MRKSQTGRIYFKDRDEEYSRMFKATTDTIRRLSIRCGWPHTFDREKKFLLVPLGDLPLVKKILKKWGIPFEDKNGEEVIA